jgi:hypothetical protein
VRWSCELRIFRRGTARQLPSDRQQRRKPRRSKSRIQARLSAARSVRLKFSAHTQLTQRSAAQEGPAIARSIRREPISSEHDQAESTDPERAHHPTRSQRRSALARSVTKRPHAAAEVTSVTMWVCWQASLEAQLGQIECIDQRIYHTNRFVHR